MCRPFGKFTFFCPNDVFENVSFRALKLAANHEKRLFTFFGFLPPYFDVSGALAYPMGRDLTRSIASYHQFFISCRLARYPKINRTSIENRSKIYRTSIEHLSNIYRKFIEHLSKIYRNLLNIYRKSKYRARRHEMKNV